MEFVFLGGMRIMDEFVTLTQLSEEEREKAYCKYQTIESFLNGSSNLKSIAKKSSIPVRTLGLWVKKYRAYGLVGLARLSRSDKGISRACNSQLKKTIEGLYLKMPILSIANIHQLISTQCQADNITPPSYRSVCRIISNLPEDLIVLARDGSKVYQQQYDLLHIRSAERPNELWQADHVLLDLTIINDKNKLQNPWLTVVIDDCSRAICGYELSFLAPSSQKTSLCFRQAIWRKSDPKWEILGVPQAFYTDHGSDFTSKHIEQVCIDLKINLIFSQVGQPRGRGKIERFFRTLNQKLIQTLDVLAGKKSQKQSMDLKSLDRLIYDFIIQYNHTYHPEIKTTPALRWKEGGFLPQLLDSVEQLDLLLLTEAKTRRVLRDGIRFQGLRYIDTVLAEYVGEHVVVRYTPSDITSIRVFYKGLFLCQPVCPDLATLHIGLKEIQRARNERRRKLKQEVLERQSLVNAVIATSALHFHVSEQNDNPLYTQEEQSNQLKLYKDE